MAIDPYHKSTRLDLYSFDGAPMAPMYLAYRPPEMLPTKPLSDLTSKNNKRHFGGDPGKRVGLAGLVSKDSLLDPDRWLWLGVVMSAVGGLTLFFS